MADQIGTNSKPFDAMNPWRGMRNAYLESWAKFAAEMVNSEQYSEASGAMLNTYLAVSAPFSEAFEKYMLKALEQFAMPSRADVMSIAERLTNIEIRLDDLDAKLDQVMQVSGSAVSGVRRDATHRETAKRNRKGRK